LVGRDIYEKLIRGYTEKQWGTECRHLPAFIIKRIPLRFTYDNNYFDDRYQGVPVGGYTCLVRNLLADVDVILDTDYFDFIRDNPHIAERVVYTGQIDAFFGYCCGELEYRSLRFETETLCIGDYQGNAVVNFTDSETPYTRVIEHKHFERGAGNAETTVITKEYPAKWKRGLEPYYPINNDSNNQRYERYRVLSEGRPDVIFGGRLGKYRYFDMDEVVSDALSEAEKDLKA
jgi:UDP-galactopyranose mutase